MAPTIIRFKKEKKTGIVYLSYMINYNSLDWKILTENQKSALLVPTVATYSVLGHHQ